MRVLLRDLTPGQDYLMQFRSNNGESVSEWSKVYNFTTVGDGTPPADPSNLDWKPTGESFIGTWTAPTLDSNGKPLKDFHHYEITVEAGVKTKVYSTTDTTWEFTLVMNAEAFGGIELTVKITVKAVDNTGNKSPGVNKTATEDTPPIPSTPIVTNTMGQIAVEWDGSTSVGIINPFNLEYVEIHASTTNNFTPADATLVGRFEGWIAGKQRTIVPGLTYGSLYYFKLVSVNKKGKKSNPSPQASGTPTRISGLDITNNTIGTSQINFTARQLGGANAYYGTTLPTGTNAPDGTPYKEGDIFYNVAIPPAANAGKTYRRNAAGAWPEDASIGVISGSKILTNTLTADAVGTNLIITASANIGNAVIDDAKIANVKAGKIVAEETATNLIIANTANIKDAIITSAKILNLSADKITTGSLQANQKIIAGLVNSDHAEMSSTGFRVYASDPTDGIPNEVIRMGTDTNDFFGVVNSSGQLVASVDDTGSASFSRIVSDNIAIRGTDIQTMISVKPRGQIARFYASPGGDIGLIYSPYGIAELGVSVQAGRAYRIDWRFTYAGNVAGDEAIIKMRYTQGANGNSTSQPAAPTINSSELASHLTTHAYADRWESVNGQFYFNAHTTSIYRFLLTLERGGGGSALGTVRVVNQPVEISIHDMGPIVNDTGNWNGGGGTLYGGGTNTPPPSSVQQYYVDIAPSSWTSFRGDGSQRTDYDGIVQGWDPSGFNGEGGGFWMFGGLPSITGTVDRVDFYCYTDHWYNNSGGTAILNMVPFGVGNNWNAFKLRGDWYVGGYQKPGGKEVTLPSDWWNQFHNTPASGGRAFGISLGRGGGTNLTYYGKFQGPSARLRIYYTQ